MSLLQRMDLYLYKIMIYINGLLLLLQGDNTVKTTLIQALEVYIFKILVHPAYLAQVFTYKML